MTEKRLILKKLTDYLSYLCIIIVYNIFLGTRYNKHCIAIYYLFSQLIGYLSITYIMYTYK